MNIKLGWQLLLCWLSLTMASNITTKKPLRCIMYFTGQHPVAPPVDQLRHVTHVAIAFMSPGVFNTPENTNYPLFTTVKEVRALFPKQTKVLIAIGGWGDTLGFSVAALTEETRQIFAENVASMLRITGADGVDIDWEYPGGNGEDYKKVPNPTKSWEISSYPLLLSQIRTAIGPHKILSAAVPGLPRDMLAFTSSTLPRIMRHLDFLNVMTYDLMNRRDNKTKHHTGVQLSIEAIQAYVSAGVAPQDLNLGFAFYTKYFRTEHDSCASKAMPLGCPTLLLENPQTGEDMGHAGGFSWHDSVPAEVSKSFMKALEQGQYDDKEGGYYFWDEEDLWWTFDTADAIKRKFPLIVDKLKLGGVFAWGLGEDAPMYEHLQAVNEGLDERVSVNNDNNKKKKDEL